MSYTTTATVRPGITSYILCHHRVRFLGSNLAALHDIIDPEELPPVLGGTLQQHNLLEWLEQQMQQQSDEVEAAAVAKASREALAAAVPSWTIADDMQGGDDSVSTEDSLITEP